MKKFFAAAAAFAAAIVFAADAPIQDFYKPANWRRSRVKDAYTIVKEGNTPVAVQFNAPCSAPFFSSVYPIDNGTDINKCYEGISFEVKGDGSNEWGTIAVFETNLTCGEYYFPVKDKEWKEYKVAFADMAPASDHTLGLPAKLPVGRIGNLNFGDRWKINWTNIKRKPFTYQVRNVKFIEKMDKVYSNAYTQARPLADVVKEMKAGKKTVEMRLFDTKRKQIRVGDKIKFTCEDGEEAFTVTVVGLHKFENFLSLAKAFLPRELGFKDYTPTQISRFMTDIYTEEKTNACGTLAIRVSLDKNIF